MATMQKKYIQNFYIYLIGSKYYVLLHFPLRLNFNSFDKTSALPLMVAFLTTLEAANETDLNLAKSSSKSASRPNT